jgi:hypothetical protein
MTAIGEMTGNPYPAIVSIVEGLERSGGDYYGSVNDRSRNRKWIPKGVAVIANFGFC